MKRCRVQLNMWKRSSSKLTFLNYVSLPIDWQETFVFPSPSLPPLKLLASDVFSHAHALALGARARFARSEIRIFWSGRVICCANSRPRRRLWMERKNIRCFETRGPPCLKIQPRCHANTELNTRVTRSDKTQTVFVASRKIRSSSGWRLAPGSTSSARTPQYVG